MTEKTSEFRIVRRAWGKYAEAETFTGTWTAAMCRAMSLEAERHDGEYSVRFPGEALTPPRSTGTCPVQAAFAYL